MYESKPGYLSSISGLSKSMQKITRYITNGILQFEKVGGGSGEPLGLGNYHPSSEAIIVSGYFFERKDPNIELQPGIDIHRKYLEGYIVDTQFYEEYGNYILENIPATINGRTGKFTIVERLHPPVSHLIGSEYVIGVSIAGYFYLT